MNERISDKGMPSIDIVNMSNELLMGNDSMFSAKLEKSIVDTIKRGEQVMIFLNRRDGRRRAAKHDFCSVKPRSESCDIHGAITGIRLADVTRVMLFVDYYKPTKGRRLASRGDGKRQNVGIYQRDKEDFGRGQDGNNACARDIAYAADIIISLFPGYYPST